MIPNLLGNHHSNSVSRGNITTRVKRMTLYIIPIMTPLLKDFINALSFLKISAIDSYFFMPT